MSEWKEVKLGDLLKFGNGKRKPNSNGEILAIVPNVKPTFQLMGATAKIDFLLIVEKTE